MKIKTVPIRYVQAILSSANYRNIDLSPVLARSNICETLLEQDKARVSANVYHNFTLYVIALMNDEYCGFLDRPAKLGTFEMMSRACINCPTLGDFIKRSIQFNNIFTDCLELKLEVNDETAHYILIPGRGMRDPDHYLSFVMFAIAHRLFSWVIGQTILLKNANFAHPRPSFANEYNYLFKSPIKFDQPLFSLSFPVSYLARPNIQTERTLDDFLNLPGLQLMSISATENSLSTKVSHMISEYVSGDFPEFELIASQLNMTSATLRRRLRIEGTSYRQIKDDLRRDTAIYNLGNSIMSIEQIAQSVGFAEPTSFFRAFRRWTGVTPRAYLGQSEQSQ